MISGRWFKVALLWAAIKDFTSVLGFFAIIITFVQFFNALKPISDFLQRGEVFALVLLCSIAYAGFKNRPRNNFVFKLNGRDVELELWIGDMSQVESSFIIPINSEFDVYLNGSATSANSVKAMVIRDFFGGDHAIIRKQIQKELKNTTYSGQREDNRYRMGTTVALELANSGRRFYFVVNSHKVSDRRVKAEEKDFYETLNGLWTYIAKHGAKENLAIPLLGTGNGRLNLQRHEVYQEIVRSFIAACSGSTFCSKLTIVVRDEDVTRYNIDVDSLVEFMKLETRYADLRIKDTQPHGVAVDSKSGTDLSLEPRTERQNSGELVASQHATTPSLT